MFLSISEKFVYLQNKTQFQNYEKNFNFNHFTVRSNVFASAKSLCLAYW